MFKKRFLLTFCAVFITVFLAYGQIVTLATAIFIGKSVKSIVSDLELTANRVLQDGQSTGNALLSKFGNELKVGTQNLNYYFSGNLDKVFDNLSVEEQNLFLEMGKIVESVNNLNSNAAKISELMNLNLIEFTNRLSFLLAEKSINYYISSINGTTLVNGNSDFKVIIRGLGLGLSHDGITYTNKIYVNNIELPLHLIDPREKHTLAVTIPNELLKQYFNDKRLVYLPFRVDTDVKRKSKTKSFSTTFNLVLLPIVAGKIVIKQKTAHDELDGEILKHSLTRTFKGCTPKKPCDYTDTWSCPDDSRIVSITYDCSGQCGWSYALRKGGRDVDYDLLDGNTTAVVYRHLDGANSTTVTHYIHYQKLKKKYREVKSDTIEFQFDVPFDVLLEQGNLDCNYEIDGFFTTGQIIKYNETTMHNSPYLKKQGVNKVMNDKCRLSLIAIKPF